jgi:hypothetical protein
MVACECAPTIITPKIISPDNYTNAQIINCIPDREILIIESDEIPLLKNAIYSNSNAGYQKINSGNSYLRLIDEKTKTSLINMPVMLEKLEYYSIIFYGYKNSAKAIIVKDSTIKEFTSGALIRFVHTSFDSGEFIFKLSGSTELQNTLNFRSITELSLIESGEFKLELVNPISNEVIINNFITVENGKTYTIILKGTSITIPEKPLFFDVIKSSFQ